jgi:uncharacterized protein YqeY
MSLNQEPIMDLQKKLQEAMKTKNDLARDLLRVILGEVATRKARSGQELSEEEVHLIIRKIIAGNDETSAELDKRGLTTHETYERLARENAYLKTLLPATLDRMAIRRELEVVANQVRAAKNDGQATGVAMKHLKQKSLAVLGEDVAAAVKDMRAG